MTVQELLRTLKTAKRVSVCPSLNNNNGALNKSSQTHFNTLLKSNSASSSSSSSSSSASSSMNLNSFLTNLTLQQLHTYISDRTIKTSDCFRIFNFVIHSQYSLSFKPDFHAYFTLICRLIRSRFFTDAEFLLDKLVNDADCRYPFEEFVHHIEKCSMDLKIITKMLNMLLKKYSDHGMFDMASTTFSYMVEKSINPDEKTCSVHLYAMIKTDKTGLAFDFFHRMVDSGMEVSVFSLTIVVSGLCKIGELKVARELVEKMSRKGVKSNVITFNTLIDACMRMWDLVELQMVLHFMVEEKIQFGETTYKVLIEGYTSCGKVEEAEKLLLEMYEKDIKVESYLYTTVIKGYCRLGKATSGLLLFVKLKERRLRFSVDIYCSLINGLCKAREMVRVKEVWTEMCKNGFLLDDDIFNTLVTGYQKAGMMDELAEFKSFMKVKCSPKHQSSIDADCKLEVIGDATNLEVIDSLDDLVNGSAEEMVVDDVLKAYHVDHNIRSNTHELCVS